MDNDDDKGISFAQRGGWWVAGQVPVLLLALLVPPLAAASPAPAPLRWAGFALVGAGLLLAAWGVFALGRSFTPFPQPAPKSALCERGPYARMRHPLYSAVMLAALGWILAWWNPHGASMLPVVVAFFALKARAEEALLARRYPAYGDYRRRVKAFIPAVY
jgi:protein-S-isoprenylcysteine O-methyltransferase Ste14